MTTANVSVSLHVARDNAALIRFVALPAANVRPMKNAMTTANVSVSLHVARENAASTRFVALPAANVRLIMNAMMMASVFPVMVLNGYESRVELF